MKILFQSYNTCCQNESGGVQNRIRKIRDLLIKRGIEVDYFRAFETKIIDYDILHVFMLEEENYNLIKYAKDSGIPVVISSIVSLNTGKKVDFYRNFIDIFPIATTYQRMALSAKMADKIITETPQEASFMIKHYKVSSDRVTVIANGADPIPVGDESIFDAIGGKKKYVLQVGRFDTNKNQISVIRALRGLNFDVVFVGGPKNMSDDYYNECISEAKGYNNIHFLGWHNAKSSLLASAYQNATIVILPSFNETFGLVALEGAMTGAHLALSKTLPICEFDVFKNTPRFSPNNLNDIRNVVVRLISQPQDEKLKQQVTSFFSWDKIIDKHLNIYKQLKNENGV